MNSKKHYSALILRKALSFISIMIVMFFLATPSQAQNTKGDRAENSGSRQNRFKGKASNKSGRQSYKGKQSYNRVTPNKYSLANAARSFQKGRKSSAPTKIYSQHGPLVNNPSSKPHTKQKAWRGSASGSRLVVRSRSGRSRNVFPQYGSGNTNNAARQPKNIQQPVSNRTELARLNRLQGSSQNNPPGRKRKVTPRSASSSFIRHKTINANAGFWNVRRKEQAITTDLAGKPLRAKNYQTPSLGVIAPTPPPHYGRKRVGDQPYKGSSSSRGRISANPHTSQKAWRGDIAGRNIRGRNFSSKAHVEGQPIAAPRRAKPGHTDRSYKGIIPGKGAKSITQSGEKRTGIMPLPVRTPGIGANSVGTFQGNVKVQRPLKGGGTRSGKSWNNNGVALQKRQPGMGAFGLKDFQGDEKTRRPVKGGGSISGRSWNNQGNALGVRTPGIGADKIGAFQGNLKVGKHAKGGGSISGKSWNNQGNALVVRTPGIGADKIGTFQGNIKLGNHAKGGGSISGKSWNNKETPISVNTPPDRARKEALFQGNFKLPGHNKAYIKNSSAAEESLLKRRPNKNSSPQANYQGSFYRFEQDPGYNDQGEEFTGFIKLPRFKKGYVKNPSAKEGSILKRRPNEHASEQALYQGSFLRFEQDPGYNDQGEEFTGFIKLPRFKKAYIKNPNTADESILKRRPNANVYKVGELQVKVIQYHYIHNASSAKEALNVREPGKAFARATDFQGDIKMRKFKIFNDFHPDAQFVKTNKNNVAEERDLLTNFKLWWGRNFRKSETQPEHLKEKERKPRYDRGEEGMWND